MTSVACTTPTRLEHSSAPSCKPLQATAGKSHAGLQRSARLRGNDKPAATTTESSGPREEPDPDLLRAFAASVKCSKRSL